MMECKYYTWNEISTRHERIVFFGTGQVFKDFIKIHSDWGDKAECLIDNDKRKQGTGIKYNDVLIPIISLEDFCKAYRHQIIVISVGVELAYDIYVSLKSKKEFNNSIIVFAPLLLDKEFEQANEKRAYPETFQIYKNQRIPKKIHYCWFGECPLPKRYLKWMESWKKFCPDFEIIRWDESNYDIYKNRFMRKAYESGKWSYVSDYVRIDVVYNEGGVYLDTDVELLKPLDELLYQDGFMGTEDGKVVSTGLGMGSEKKNPFLKGILDLYSDVEFDPESPVPCPRFQLPYFISMGYKQTGDYQILKGMTILPGPVLSPKSVITGETRIDSHTFSIHHFDASWVSDEKKKRIEKGRELFIRTKNGTEYGG